MDEIWKDIEGYEGLYQVSNMGRIRSLDKIVNNNGGTRFIKGKILNQRENSCGYKRVNLCKNSKSKMFLVHRLVYAAFNGEITEGMQVNHINEDKTDNRLCNLNLMTSKENNNWGTHNERIRKAKSKQVVGYDDQGNVVVTFPSTMDAQRYGYHSGHISSCCRGKKYNYKGLYWEYKNGDC